MENREHMHAFRSLIGFGRVCWLKYSATLMLLMCVTLPCLGLFHLAHCHICIPTDPWN